MRRDMFYESGSIHLGVSCEGGVHCRDLLVLAEEDIGIVRGGTLTIVLQDPILDHA